MFELHLIRINANNRADFRKLFPESAPVQSSEAQNDCTNLNDPEHARDVNAFISDNGAHSLKRLEIKPDTHFLYQFDDASQPPVKPDAITRPLRGPNNEHLNIAEERSYSEYINNLKKLISVKITESGKALFVEMDPLPVGEEVAILFREGPAHPWAISSNQTKPKIDYIQDLINHGDIPGIPSQLGITKFANGNEILHRFYWIDPTEAEIAAGKPGHLETATLHIRKTDGTIERFLTNEDYLLHQFMPHQAWLEFHRRRHGAMTQFKRVINTDQCNAFVANEGQFAVFKTQSYLIENGQRIIRNGKFVPVVHGNFLQRDINGNTIVQENDRSVLEQMMLELYGLPEQQILPSPLPPPVVISTPTVQEASIDAWWGRDTKNITSVTEPTKGTVKVEFTDGAYLLDTGKKLALHGTTNAEHLGAMVQHASEHWEGKFHIENGSHEIKRDLWILGKAYGLTVTGYTPSDQDKKNAVIARQKVLAVQYAPSRPGGPVLPLRAAAAPNIV